MLEGLKAFGFGFVLLLVLSWLRAFAFPLICIWKKVSVLLGSLVWA
jgi:hypothetical protein